MLSDDATARRIIEDRSMSAGLGERREPWVLQSLRRLITFQSRTAESALA
jgi:hypothetical protein